MTRRKIIVIELTGLAIVLLSAGWEFFIERELSDISQDAAFYRIERKLDNLWWQVGAIRYRVEPNPGYSESVISHPEASKEWPFAGYKAEFEGLSRQTALAKKLRAIGFLCGSVLLLFARAFELFDKEGRDRKKRIEAGCHTAQDK